MKQTRLFPLLGMWLLCASLFSPRVFGQLPAGFSATKVQDGYTAPAGVIFSPTGQQMVVWEIGGKVYMSTWNGSSYVKQLTPMLDISPEVASYRDFGLMCVAMDPNFSSNGYLYLLYTVDRHHLLYYGTSSYSATTNDYYKATIHRVTRYKVQNSGGTWTTDYTSRKVLIGESISTGVPVLMQSHGVGTLVFGKDGTLMISTGDNASYNTNDVGSSSDTYYQQAIADGILRPAENVGAYRAQMITSLCGKVLRIDPNTGDGVSSNPFYDASNPRAARSRVWSLGFRNPFRMGLWPGTGSINPADANPGSLLIGDVGMNTWEDFHVVSQSAENCGWPYFEGQNPNTGYANLAATTFNTDEPNPNNTCNQPYFSFANLIKQGKPNNNDGAIASLPCNNGSPVGNQRRFFHSRPALAWKHGVNETLLPGFSGTTPTTYALGTNGSIGTQFAGNSATGGAFYNGTSFPTAYQNGYFFGDYGANWIKFAVLNNEPGNWVKEVKDFAPAGSTNGIVDLEVCPIGQTLFYVNINSGEIMRISYGGNLPPIAAASANIYYGTSPLTVNFSSAGSSDPNGNPITYLWNFGDGTTSTSANPTKIYSGTGIVGYQVTLTVTDNAGLSDTKKLVISLNNTPPVAKITNPINGSLYSMTTTSLLHAKGTLTDNNPTNAVWKWQVSLRHNNHAHVEPEVTGQNPIFTITPIGCDGNNYYYFILLTITDNGGLVSKDSVKIYPDCSNSMTGCKGLPGTGLLREIWYNVTGSTVSSLTSNARYPNTPDVIDIFTGSVGTWNIAENYGSRVRGFITPTVSGTYYLTITGDDETELYFSNSANPAQKTKVASIPYSTGINEFNKYASQKSAALNLIAGQDYYIELLQKEAAGGDGWGIYWTLPGSTTPVTITTDRLSPLSGVCSNCTAPTVICKNISVVLNGSSVSITPDDVDDGSSPGSCGSIQSKSLSQSTFTSAGTYSVVLTVTNTNGLSASCNAQVTVTSCTAPQAICKNISVAMVGGVATITANDVDNGSTPGSCGSIQSKSISQSTFTSPGTYSVVLTVTNTNGLSASCNAQVTVTNCTAPQAICKNISVAMVSGVATITANDVDNGSTPGTCGSIQSKSISQSTFTSAGTYSVVLTVTNTNGLSASCNAQVTVTNCTAPQAICKNISVVLSGGSASITANDVDNGSTPGSCSALAGKSISQTTFTALGTYPVTLTITNTAGQTASCIAQVTVTATTPPPTGCDGIVITPGAGTITVSGLTAPRAYIHVFNAGWSVVYVCAGDCQLPVQTVNGLAAGNYFVKAELVGSDWTTICKKEQSVSVTAGSGGGTGVLTLGSVTNYTVSALPGQNTAVATFPAPTATTTCASQGVSLLQTAGLPSGSDFPVGTNTIIYTATDACGNQKTTSFTVTVSSAGSGNCNAITYTPGNGSITVSGLDAPIRIVQMFNSGWQTVFSCSGTCGGGTSLVVDALVPGSYYCKTTLYTAGWQFICDKNETVVVNGSGTGSVLTFNTPPTVEATAPAGQTGMVVTYPTPSASTTCATGNVTVTRVSGLASGSTFPVGTSTVVFSATDGCGNTKTASLTIVVNAAATGGDCSGISIVPGPGSITVSNLTAPVVYIQVFSSSWNTVYRCVANECTLPTQVIPNLPAGTYYVKVDFNTAAYATICQKEQTVTVPAGSFQSNFDDKALVFNAYKNDWTADLKWISKNASGTESFVIERSTDGLQFEVIGTLDAKSLTDAILYLDFTDEKPLFGANYYRIVRINTVGNPDISAVKSVLMPAKGIRLFPNPAGKNVHIYCGDMPSSAGKCTLINLLGVPVLEKSITDGDFPGFDLDISNLENGTYVLVLDLEGQRRVVEKLQILQTD